MNQLVRYLSIAIIFILSTISGYAERDVRIEITKGQKAVYKLNDELELSIWITTDPKTCLDGMNGIKLFQSGIEIKSKSEWKELRKGLWQKDIRLMITGNKKNSGMLTIMRRVDKQSFTHQEMFPYVTN